MTGRVLKRPPQGWDNRNPNWALPDLCAFVGLLFVGACAFNWAAAALDAVLSGIG